MPRFTKKVKQSRKTPITFSELVGSAQGIFCARAKVHPPRLPLPVVGSAESLCWNAVQSVSSSCCLPTGRNASGQLQNCYTEPAYISMLQKEDRAYAQQTAALRLSFHIAGWSSEGMSHLTDLTRFHLFLNLSAYT